MLSRSDLIRRARDRSEEPGDYWSNFANMLSRKPGVGIAFRGQYSQPEWQWYQQAKAELTEAWE